MALRTWKGLGSQGALGTQRIATEGERSAKTPQWLPAILYGLARTYDGILYFCSKATYGVMQRAIAEVSEPARRKFSLIELPPATEPGMEANRTPHPAPPQRAEGER